MRRVPSGGQVSGRWYRAARLSPRFQYIVFFGLAGLVAVGAAVIGKRRHPVDVLTAVPRGAWLLATVDVAALRPSPVAQALVGADGVTVPGLGRLADACGFEPLAHLTEVALVAPEGEGEFGVAFAGDFDKRALSECASRIVRARGGEPRTETHGSFTLVGPGGTDTTGGEAKHARLAYRDGGPFLVGRGAWLLTMIDAVDGKVERAAPELLALRASLAKPEDTRGGTAPPRSIVVTALLPKGTRDQLRAEVEDHAAPPNAAYAGILAVDRIGVAVATGAPGSMTALTAEVHCETAEACAAVKTLVEQRRFAASGNPAFRLLGLGAAIDSLVVEARGPALSAHAEAPTDALARLATRFQVLAR
jgi:hypothetical protein